ncbi:LacI family DNA-binding transcriptional regulator [Arenibacter sp. ARW7G5Y1]|uniref:LacI family DNA-binding transcriptional regulator n=1 Tax=Arenibacter sp. ARW7G5Y1 TaxID=2135619 RepID=UPI000D768772|nr:LacI family DNA-binding transcriptional regulator [Arenibacter sp. ARW7G5Y1]PXX21664.1 LacI family transcriptional regulator [Arenibacter sp. ARW7G5Y1]
MSVTLKDVAAYAGSGVSTVSVVLNGKGVDNRISEEMIKRIYDAAEHLNYRPNMLARNLRRGNTNIIGFVISDVSNPFFNKLAKHLEAEALKYGYQLFVVGSDEKDERCIEVINVFLSLKMDGLILAATAGIEKKIKQLRNHEVPFLLVDRYFPKIDTNYVVLNNWQAAYDATEHLIKKGKKRISTFSYETKFFHMDERMKGYKAALKDNGIRFNKKLVLKVPFLDIKEEDMKENVRFLVEDCNIDAIFFQTNRTAIPGIMALYELEYKIPDKVAIVCFDDNNFFKMLSPKITSLAQPIEEIAIESVRILIDEIKNKRVDKQKSKTMFSSRLIERESS